MPDTPSDIAETIAALQKLLGEGKIRPEPSPKSHQRLDPSQLQGRNWLENMEKRAVADQCSKLIPGKCCDYLWADPTLPRLITRRTCNI